MKDLKAIRGARLLARLVAEGEHEQQDFKFAVSDPRKIARSISAFANRRGGRLLIGVKDNGVIAGVRNEEDIFVVEQAAEHYCRPQQTVDFKAYRCEPGVNVIIATIAAAPTPPVCVAEADGSLKAYVRVADQNIAAHPLMMKAWQTKRRGNITFALDSVGSAVLRLLADRHLDDARQAALLLHLPEEVAEECVVQLAAMEMIDFRFDGSKFTICRRDD